MTMVDCLNLETGEYQGSCDHTQADEGLSVAPVSPVSPASYVRGRARKGRRRRTRALEEIWLEVWGFTIAGRMYVEPNRANRDARMRQAIQEAKRLHKQAVKAGSLSRDEAQRLWQKLVRECWKRCGVGSDPMFPIDTRQDGSPYPKGVPGANYYHAADDPPAAAWIFLEVERVMDANQHLVGFATHRYVLDRSLEDFGQSDWRRRQLQAELFQCVAQLIEWSPIHDRSVIERQAQELSAEIEKAKARKRRLMRRMAKVLAPRFQAGYKPVAPPECTTLRERMVWEIYEKWASIVERRGMQPREREHKC